MRSAKQLRNAIAETAKPDPHRAAAGVLTVDQIALAQVQRMRTRGRAERSLADFENARRNLFGALGQRRVGDVTRSDVDAWVAGRVAAGLAPKTVRNVRGHLHDARLLAACLARLGDSNPELRTVLAASLRRVGVQSREPASRN
ncbi:MAG: hypothetical protein QOE87_2324 [Gaiellales bacterium]|jgi:hypothetical protein|nr:hypothetical protein [Gaiellales bacterium]